MVSPAERKRLSRERQKKALESAPDVTASYIKRPFHDYIANLSLGIEESLDAAGIHISGSLEDPIQEFETEAEWNLTVDGLDPRTSLGRATIMVDVLLNAAQELAGVINDFKLEELGTAIEVAFTASAGLARDDVEGLKASFAEIDRLKALQTRLGKQARHFVPVTQVKDE